MISSAQPNVYPRQFKDAAEQAAEEAAFALQCEIENARLDALFFEARRIAREHPEMMRTDEFSPALREHWNYIVKNDTYDVVACGKVIRTDPVPQTQDEFVELVAAFVEHGTMERDMDSFFNQVTLSAESLRARVQRNLMSFTDFQRAAKTGQPDPTNPDNVRIFLKMQDIELRWNAWFCRQEIKERASWELGRKEKPWALIDDTTLNRLLTLAGDSQYQFRPADATFRRTVETIARETEFDPVVDYLADVENKWDGTPRLVTWLSMACGVPCDAYHQAVGKNLIGGMVKRARKPGAKHDEVVIFMGPQGTFKSTLCRTLATRAEYFTDSVAFDGSPQNVVPQLFGKWVVELSELDGMANRETAFLKRFISSTTDTVTLKYRALASDYARRCVFIGTTNDDRVLRDATGNRRFLPVRINQAINLEWVRQNLDQIFAEAAVLESRGHDFAIPAEVIPAATEAQESARSQSDFETFIETWFGGELSMLVTAADVAALLRDATGRSVPPNRYGATMKRLGFLDTTTRIDAKPARVWRRGTADAKAARVIIVRDASGRMVPRIPFPFGGVTPVTAVTGGAVTP